MEPQNIWMLSRMAQRFRQEMKSLPEPEQDDDLLKMARTIIRG